MRSFVRIGRRRKKMRRIGKARVLTAEALEAMELDARVETIRALIPLGLRQVAQELDAEVERLAGGWHARKPEEVTVRRHGTNPGSVRLAGQWVPVRVPRLRDGDGEVELESYRACRKPDTAVNERLMKRVLYGISCRNYEAAALSVPGALGLTKSSVSRAFVEASAKELKAFQERDLSGEDYVALFLDGKAFADDLLVVALGVTMEGEKRMLGFVEADTENAEVLAPFLRDLVDRGLDIEEGLLVVIDGAKGLKKAVEAALNGSGKRRRAVVQRCQWHKRENVVKHLAKAEQPRWRKKLQEAYERPTHAEAKAALDRLVKELEEVNLNAADSLREGLEETLTLHRIGVFALLGKSLKTTNCIESVLSQVEDRCAKVDTWTDSTQKHRWMAAALRDIQPRLNRIRGYEHLPRLREAIRKELKLNTGGTRNQKKAA